MKGLDIKEISGDCIKTTLQQVIEKRLGSKDIEIFIEPGSKKGDNFIGEIYRILYKLKADNKENEQKSLILKIAAQNVTHREKFKLRYFFEREIRMYEESLPIIYDFQLSKDVIPEVEGFNECAKCYYIIKEELSESLFLEDLKVNQYEMLDHRTQCLTFEHVSLVMKALGKLHAVSFALRDQQPSTFAQITGDLKEYYWRIHDKDFKAFFESMRDRTMKTLNEENNTELSEKFLRATKKGFGESAVDCITGSLAEPYAVLCHGDVWINNTMFRNDAQGKAIGVKLFDWQFSRYASVATDIVLYLLSCTTKALRDQHYDELLKIYHESLSTLLRKLGSDPNKLFPFEALLEQLKQFGKYGVITGSILLSIFLAEPDTIPDLGDLSEKLNEYDGAVNDLLKIPENAKAEYNCRMRDMMEDAARFEYI